MASKEQTLKQLHQLQRQALTLNKIEPVDTSKCSYIDYREQIEAAKPSADPSYWAKPGCHGCHGTGVVGMTTTQLAGGNILRQGKLCGCAERRWQRWQDEFVAKLRAEKFEKREPVQLEFEAVNTSQPACTETHADPKAVQALDQIERLWKRIAGIQAKAADLRRRSEQLPQRQPVAAAQHQLAFASGEHAGAAHRVEGLQLAADDYEAEAKQLLAKAATIRQELKSVAKPALEAAVGEVRQAHQAAALAEKQLRQADHQLQKRIREFERQEQKLQARIVRIQRENDLYHSVFTAEETDSSADLNVPSDS